MIVFPNLTWVYLDMFVLLPYYHVGPKVFFFSLTVTSQETPNRAAYIVSIADGRPAKPVQKDK